MALTGNDGAASIHALATRVTALNADGSVSSGNAMYVSDALVQLVFDADIEAGPETVTRNAAGALCVIYKMPDIVKRLTVTVDLCTPDPQLEALLTGGTVFVSGGASGVVEGYQYPAVGIDPVPNGVSIEVWTHALIKDHVDTARPYMHWVFPHVYNLHKTNRTIDVNPLVNSFTGYGISNPSWGSGPDALWPWDSSAVAQWARETSYPTPQLGLQTASA